MLNFQRMYCVGMNVKTLSALLNHEGELAFRAELLRAFEVASLDLRADDIDVRLAADRGEFDIRVRSKWTYDVPGVRQFAWPKVHTFSVRQVALLADTARDSD